MFFLPWPLVLCAIGGSKPHGPWYCVPRRSHATTFLCLFGLAAGAATTDAYVKSDLNTTLPVSAVLKFADHSANVMFATSSNTVYKLNGTSLDVLDSVSIGVYDNKLRWELYASKGWLFVWSGSTLTKLNAPDLANPIATLDISDIYDHGINNVVIDEARRLAYAVSYHSNVLVIIDVVTMNVTARFNFTSKFNSNGETGAYSMAYDARRKVLWIGVYCAYGVTAHVWQINMRTAPSPSIISATPFGGNTCFYADPVIDPQGSGIAWFSDEDTNNVIGVDTEGKWNSDRVFPFPVYSDYSAVDIAHKQGFYLSVNFGGNNFVYRACYNSRPVTYTTTRIPQLNGDIGIAYDAATKALYVSDTSSPSNVYVYNVTGTDCPQESASTDESAASMPASSALWSLLSLILA